MVGMRPYRPPWVAVARVTGYLGRALHDTPIIATPRQLARLRAREWELRERVLRIVMTPKDEKRGSVAKGRAP